MGDVTQSKSMLNLRYGVLLCTHDLTLFLLASKPDPPSPLEKGEQEQALFHSPLKMGI